MDVGNSPVVGIEVWGDELRAVRLQRKGRRLLVDEELDGEGLVVSALDSSDVLVRQLQLDVAKAREIAKVRDFQIEPLLPVPMEEAVLCHQVVGQDEGGITLSVISALKTRLTAHLELLKAKGIEPEQVCCVPVALARLLEELSPEPQGVIHLGHETTTCAVVKGGAVLASRSLGIGVRDLEKAPANFLDFDLVGGNAERLRAEVSKSFLALTRKRGQRVSQVFALGEFALFPNLDSFVGQALDVPLSPLPEKEGFEARLAVPMGVALGVMNGCDLVDFRQKELAYRRPLRRFRKQLGVFAGAALLLAGALGFWGQTAVSAKRAEVATEYVRVAELVGGEVEENLPVEAMRLQVREWDKQLKGEPELFALVPNVPRMSDVVAWLGSEEAIQVESLQYSLVRRPTQRKQNERYQIRLDLEFSADSSTQARAFHDKLLAGHPMIDPKSEVRWSTAKGGYRASFFLRDRTFYPRRIG